MMNVAQNDSYRPENVLSEIFKVVEQNPSTPFADAAAEVLKLKGRFGRGRLSRAFFANDAERATAFNTLDEANQINTLLPCFQAMLDEKQGKQVQVPQAAPPPMAPVMEAPPEVAPPPQVAPEVPMKRGPGRPPRTPVTGQATVAPTNGPVSVVDGALILEASKAALKGVADLGAASKANVDALNKRLDALEQKLDLLLSALAANTHIGMGVNPDDFLAEAQNGVKGVRDFLKQM